MVCALLALRVVVAVVAMVGVVLVVVVMVVALAVREIGAFAAVMVITASGAVVGGAGTTVGRLGTEGPDCPAASGGVSTMYGMFTDGGSGPTGGLSGAPTVVIGAGTVTAGALPAEGLLRGTGMVGSGGRERAASALEPSMPVPSTPPLKAHTTRAAVTAVTGSVKRRKRFFMRSKSIDPP